MCLGFTTISFLQFSIFGTVLPLLTEELKVGYGLMGTLIAMWTLIAAISPFTIGRLLAKVAPFRIMIFILIFSFLSALLTAFSYDLVTLNAARLLQIISLPFTWPTSARLVSAFVSGRNYGYVTAIYNTGSIIGFALPYVIMVLVNYAWRLAVIIAGLLSLFYLIPLLVAWKSIKESRGCVEASYSRQPELDGLIHGQIQQKDAIRLGLNLFLGHFCAMFTWHFMITWLSTFLVVELGLGYGEIAVYLSVITAFSVVLEISAGIFSDRIGGLWGRTLILYFGLIPSGLLLLLSIEFTEWPSVSLILVSLAALAWRGASPSFWSIINDVVPPRQLEKFSYMYVSAAPISGIISSLMNGYIISVTNSLQLGVIISSIITGISPVFYTIGSRIGYSLKESLKQQQTKLA